MAGIEKKTFASPEEVRPFAAHGQMELVHIAGVPVGRATYEPGWKWSTDVKPIAGTDSCQAVHNGYVVSGRIKVVMQDGSEDEMGPGDVVHIDPGHDAWVVGDEPCVLIDFGSGVGNFARPA